MSPPFGLVVAIVAILAIVPVVAANGRHNSHIDAKGRRVSRPRDKKRQIGPTRVVKGVKNASLNKGPTSAILRN